MLDRFVNLFASGCLICITTKDGSTFEGTLIEIYERGEDPYCKIRSESGVHYILFGSNISDLVEVESMTTMPHDEAILLSAVADTSNRDGGELLSVDSFTHRVFTQLISYIMIVPSFFRRSHGP